MKKLLIAIVALAAVTTASAQEFNWGLKAGANFSSIYGNDVNVKMKTDFTGGVFGEYKTNEWFGINAEILYAGQGYSFDATGDVTGKVTINTTNLNIPIMANFHVTKFLSLGTGVQPEFLMGARYAGAIDADASKNFNKFSMSIPVNVRFQLDCGLLFDVRYNLGVTNIWKNSPDNAYNNGFAVTVGWKF